MTSTEVTDRPDPAYLARLPLGVDIGGTGMKAAPVDLDVGDFAAERVRERTPHPATPQSVADALARVVSSFPVSDAPVGVTMPGIVRHGVVGSAANIDAGWIGTDADALFSRTLGRAVHVVNDADAAGLAEATYGAARGRRGLVLVTTLGTGIGSALVHDGRLVPSSELGHLELDGHVAEHRAANSAREREELTMEAWAERLNRFYRHLERLFSPDLFVVGGGISKKADDFLPLLRLDTEIVPATLRNRAGIVGAALEAERAAQA